MLTRISAASLLVAFASVANAGMVEVELIPDNPGPYYGGESLTVDVWLHSQVDFDVALERLRFDFTDSHAAVSVGSIFEFDFSSIPNDLGGYVLSTFPELPLPWTYMSLDCLCPGAFMQLGGEHSIHIGRIDVRLPQPVGSYRLDILNADEPNALLGAEITASVLPLLIPVHEWRAHTGDIEGGGYQFVVVPEPSTLVLAALGGVYMCLKRNRKLSRSRVVQDLSVQASGVYNTSRLLRALLGLLAVLGPQYVWVPPAAAQPELIPAETVAVPFDSDLIASPAGGDGPAPVFSQVVSVAGVRWMRLHFAHVQLGGSERVRNGSFIRITSLEDGATQTLNSSALAVWRNSSGYFNGDSVFLQLFAYPQTGDNRIAVDKVLAGGRNLLPGGSSRGGRAACETDDRVRSDDQRVARLLYSVEGDLYSATAFIVNDRAHCLFSAGHACNDFDFTGEFVPIIEFNVPDSDSGGSIRFALAQDTYVIDEESIVYRYHQASIHIDWCYFGTENNTETALSPYEAQGESFRLAYLVPYPGGQTLRVTGHGRDYWPPEDHTVQQTDSGQYLYLDPIGVLTYDIFTIKGVSGGPVEDMCRGFAYGIHTRGGCPPGNIGVAVDMPDLQDAVVANWIDSGYYEPQGICGAPQDCNENGIDDYCDLDCDAPGCTPPCGGSEDCTGNYIPDECETDCNSNGVADSCDVLAGTSDDVDDNGVPDECQPDVFVDVNAPDGGDGSSWATAYNDLQDALTPADPCGMPVKRVWVAAGTYKPDGGTGNRNDSFEPPGTGFGTALYGGFAGDEIRLDQRDPGTNVTILSGDIGLVGDASDNSYHVVQNPGGLHEFILDGFTVTAGNANGVGAKSVGGGVYTGGYSTIVNCVFRGNSAYNFGGAIYASGNSTVTNCLFQDNTADLQHGGGFYSYSGAPTLTNCTFSANDGGWSGGGAYIASGTAIFTNCIVWGNTPDQIIGNATVSHSDIDGGWSGGGSNNIDLDPEFFDPDGEDDMLGTEDDDFRLYASSPCIETGDTSAVTVGIDLDGNPRLVDANGDDVADVDMGAYEFTCRRVDRPEADPAVADVGFGTRNRYLSLIPGTPLETTALRVRFEALPDPFGDHNGEVRWVKEAGPITEVAGVAGPTPPPTFEAADLDCEIDNAHWTDWSPVEPVHLYDAGVVPGAVYHVQAVHNLCDPEHERNFSAPLVIETSVYGDVTDAIVGCEGAPCPPPDGTVDMPDIEALVYKFSHPIDEPKKTRSDLGNGDMNNPAPDHKVDMLDIALAVDAYLGNPYPYSGPADCP